MQSSAVWLVLLLALCGANLPFVSRQRLLGLQLRRPKSLALRLLEWLLLYLLVGAVGLVLEARIGQIAPQGWQFYAVTLAMFAVLAFPGFVLRYLWRRQPG